MNTFFTLSLLAYELSLAFNSSDYVANALKLKSVHCTISILAAFDAIQKSERSELNEIIFAQQTLRQELHSSFFLFAFRCSCSLLVLLTFSAFFAHS